MVRKFLCVSLILAMCAGLAACGVDTLTSTAPTATTSLSTAPTVGTVDASEQFTDRDYETNYTENDSVYVYLEGYTVRAQGPGVEIDGTTVTLTADTTYIISGTLIDGMIIVDAPESAKLQIVLDNATIHSESSAALYIRNGDKVFLTLADGTVNTLSNSGNYTLVDDSNVDATLFSKQDLTMNGAGTLTIASPGGHGIVCKDDLVITGGTYHITSASHGIAANDSIRLDQVNLTVDAGKDGLHAENSDNAALGYVFLMQGTLNLEAEGDGVSAGSYLQIVDGTVNILAGGGYENGKAHSSGGWGDFGGGPGGAPPGGGRPKGGTNTAAQTSEESSSSMKGLKAGSTILIQNGNFTIDSADDAVHAGTSCTIEGGLFQIATGDDALHAEENLTVTDGTIEITQSYEGLEAQHISVSGGNIRLKATDDGLNAAGGTDSSGTGGRDQMYGGRPGGMGGASNGSITITGGTLYIHASGDGIDANGTLTISGGHVTVVGPTQGDTATLDYDISGVITGGTFIGTGSDFMAQTFSDSQQGIIAIKVGTQSAGTQITLTDSNGKVLFSYAPELGFAVVILSSPEMVKGATYTVTIGQATKDIQAS